MIFKWNCVWIIDSSEEWMKGKLEWKLKMKENMKTTTNKMNK